MAMTVNEAITCLRALADRLEEMQPDDPERDGVEVNLSVFRVNSKDILRQWAEFMVNPRTASSGSHLWLSGEKVHGAEVTVHYVTGLLANRERHKSEDEQEQAAFQELMSGDNA